MQTNLSGATLSISLTLIRHLKKAQSFLSPAVFMLWDWFWQKPSIYLLLPELFEYMTSLSWSWVTIWNVTNNGCNNACCFLYMIASIYIQKKESSFENAVLKLYLLVSNNASYNSFFGQGPNCFSKAVLFY